MGDVNALPTTSVDELPATLPDEWQVLDVREDWEWSDGHVPGAVHIPLAELPTRVGELDPGRPTLVVCHVGARSARATMWLSSLGHQVVNLEGGMDAWLAAGRATSTD